MFIFIYFHIFIFRSFQIRSICVFGSAFPAQLLRFRNFLKTRYLHFQPGSHVRAQMLRFDRDIRMEAQGPRGGVNAVDVQQKGPR